MISGIPDRCAAVLITAGLFFAGGCEVAKPEAPDRLNATPIVEDQAMQLRAWPRVNAAYPSFSSTTGPTDTVLIAKRTLPPYLHAAAETPIFVADLFIIPIVIVEGVSPPPWMQVESTSFYIPPSYTANPPLEPVGRNDYSGRSGLGYNLAPGRSVRNPAPVPAVDSDADPQP